MFEKFMCYKHVFLFPVGSWPKLKAKFWFNEKPMIEECVTLMITRKHVCIFKYKTDKLPNLWQRFAFEELNDMRYDPLALQYKQGTMVPRQYNKL